MFEPIRPTPRKNCARRYLDEEALDAMFPHLKVKAPTHHLPKLVEVMNGGTDFDWGSAKVWRVQRFVGGHALHSFDEAVGGWLLSLPMTIALTHAK